MSVVDDVRQQISKRLKELKPLVDEYHQLEAMVRKLAAGDGALSSPGRSSTRRRTTRSTDGRRRGRPRGSGTRSAQALALVEAKPGITLPLCEAEGLRNAFVARRDKDGFRIARKKEWGDLF